MKVLRMFALGAGCAVAAREFRLLKHFLVTLAENKHNERSPSSTDVPTSRRRVLIVSYQEGDTLADTIIHFLPRLDDDTTLSIVTTTESLTPALSRFAHHDRCEILDLDLPKLSKVGGISFFLNRDFAETMVTIYDADSRPTTVGCEHPGDHVCQQLSIYRAPPDARPFWRGVATAQSFWCLSNETAMLRSKFYYLVGHGLSLPSDRLRSNPLRDGVPGEDMLVGYELSHDGVGVMIAHGFDVAGVPTNLIEFWTQSGRWFLGETSALAEMIRNRKLSVRLVLHCIALVWWPLGPPALGFLAVTAAAMKLRGDPRLGAVLLSLVLIRVIEYTATAYFIRQTLGTKAGEEHVAPLAELEALLGFFAKPVLSAGGACWSLAKNGLSMHRGAPFAKARAV